ncbi:MAG: putative inorganic carbon transporter subunit DabA, partial [Pseudomonadota bacterium]|nr:putative inorganic carbon transporter subunit DabA [Pseudomonadota bacterium]
IMTAPMVVTHWINLQYFMSVTDNLHYGSGNKVLHNVVGGHIGVFEGNGGDLRIGLPLQSVHDGERWVHEPLRLSVYLAAPREAIAGIAHKHPVVQQLIDNDWLYLFRIDDDQSSIERYYQDEWRAHA